MRKVSVAMRAGTPPLRSIANRQTGRTAAAAGGVTLALLSILFWYIFYQNLPGNLGLNVIVSFSHSVGSSNDVSNANTADRIMKICMIVMSTYVIATRWSLVRPLARYINLGAVAVLVLAGMSAVWSIEPGATMLRFVTLVSIFLICFAVSIAGWERRRFQQLVIPPLMFILVASLVVGLIFPDRIMELGDDLSQKDAWHGITLTKNQFGMAASLAAIICANTWLAREGRTWWSIAGATIALVCLALSRSNTSMFATLIGVGFMVAVLRVPVIRQRFTTPLVVAITGAMLLYELVIQNVLPGAHTLLAPVRGLTGKDATFSNRTIIWDAIKDHIQGAPYLGSGYGAYWIGAVPTSPSYIFKNLMYFYPTEAHNGYLDIVNDLGYVGLIGLLAFLFIYIRQALQLLQIDRNQAALYLALLFQQLVMNMQESEWFARDSEFTVFILAIVCLSRALYEGRLRAQPAARRRQPL
jgi:exopolysaccharide production protein ExoQ